MSYLRAKEILPKEVLELVQQYVSGKAIYVPCREKQPWGDKSAPQPQKSGNIPQSSRRYLDKEYRFSEKE